MGHTRFASVLLAIILAASVSVITPARAEDSDAVAATVAVTVAATVAETVAATVDGENVLVSEVDSLAATLLAQYPTAPLDDLKRQVVQRLVERKLILRAAVKAGLDKDPAVLKRLEALKGDVLQEIFLTNRVDEEVTEDKLRAAYKQMTSKLSGQEELHARHILIADEDEAAAKALIVDLQGGADFVELAKEHSIGPSKDRGGDLGFFRKEAMVPAFSKAAFELKDGGFTAEPVKTRFGWHIIKVEERRQIPVPTYEESVEELRGTEAQLVINRLLDSLSESAAVQVFEDTFSTKDEEPTAE